MDIIENMMDNMNIESDYDSDDDIFVILTEEDRQYAIAHRNYDPAKPLLFESKKPSELVIKTLVCQSIKKKIRCKFSNTCTFAHTYSELRIAPCKNIYCNRKEQGNEEPCPYIHEGESIPSFNARTMMHRLFPTEVQPPLPPPVESKETEFYPPLPPLPPQAQETMLRPQLKTSQQFPLRFPPLHPPLHPPLPPPLPSSLAPQGRTHTPFLQTRVENSKYKTQLCKNKDNCPFGVRCKFAHSFSELRK